ncbi:MAG: acetyl-CoA carboxylase biotin carboxyl carrier protein subunit, partial [Anaerolineae bacterium]|nr:acetyl-CoA carboxylase biotin carboxyl carrier protein subunit [Anaerolineae bacterium]
GISLLSESRSFHAHVSGDPDQVRVKVRGVSYRAAVLSDREWHFRHLGGAGGGPGDGAAVMKAPMPGKVLEIRVAPGDEVAEGQAICILEAMKMENELRAAAPGRVSEVLVEAGAAVEGDQELVRFEPLEG